MSGSSQGDEYGNNSNIDEIDEKLQNISVDDRVENDVDVDVDVDGDDDDDDDKCNSSSEHEQSSTMSQANYYDKPSLHLNSLNHLFHIDFMRSMQNLRTHEKRLIFYEIRTYFIVCLSAVVNFEIFDFFFSDLKMVHVVVQHLQMNKCVKLNVKIKFY